jgi:hypothetical protein
MARVLVVNHLTLDGVMQSPARPDEDPRDGFAHGGSGAAGNHDQIGAAIGRRMGEGRVFLSGRRRYEDFFAVWPKRPENPYAEALTNTPKYVASRTLSEPLPCANSILLKGDAAHAVAELRRQPLGTLTIFGSGDLIRTLVIASYEPRRASAEGR